MNLKAPSRTYRGRTADGQPNPVDIHVGKKIRLRRLLLSLSQEKLGEMAGLTFQQIQKYESGRNRISASRLWDISQLLSVPITYFFSDMDEQVRNQSPRFMGCNNIVEHDEHEITYSSPDPMYEEKAMIIVSAYNSISSRETADVVMKLLMELSTKKFS